LHGFLLKLSFFFIYLFQKLFKYHVLLFLMGFLLFLNLTPLLLKLVQVEFKLVFVFCFVKGLYFQ